MCGIAGFSSSKINYHNDYPKWQNVLQKMNRSQKHRGPDDDGIYLSKHCALGHVRLSIIAPDTGHQPMTGQIGNHKAAICFNGEIYNMHSLKQNLMAEGAIFETASDTEVVLKGYLLHGVSFVKELNGIFAFAIWDESLQSLFLFRDRLGVKPLFYTTRLSDFSLIFSSEIKGILTYPDIRAVLNHDGLCEIWGLGPAKTSGKGVFKDIFELRPGHYLVFNGSVPIEKCYWELQSHPHEDDWSATVSKTRDLIVDAVTMQMLSDVPICTFLSGGIDSSFVTSVCSSRQANLATYSFDFKDNSVHFKENSFQPSQDRPWVDKMVAYCHCDHHYLECSNDKLYNYLFEAVNARDLPCMADIEASMLYFCRQVAATHKVALTGECADEIFGGYPWFHKKECLNADTFPWSMDFSPRTMLLKDELLNKLSLKEYVHAAYESTINEVPTLPEETPDITRQREISYLNLKWFMQTLLDRMDRTSMYSGLEARVPFADHRIVEYLWNVPWEMKCPNGVVKGLLREAAKDYLPDDVLFRKKSPYPKTYDPAYEALLKSELAAVISDHNSPLYDLIDQKKLLEYLQSPLDYGRPFYGQLMAGPQLLAYLLQINYWIKTYHITIKL